jgi:cupin 2 domain-containing protein
MCGEMKNLFSSIPGSLENEMFEDLLKHDNVRIERILSKGQSSPAEGWYDQVEHEWVAVLEGCGVVSFEDGSEIKLSKGDYLNIPAHVKHRVKWTDPDRITIWLAIFYKN